MRPAILPLLFLAGCAGKTPAELAALPIDTMIESRLSAHDFAICFIDHTKLGTQLRNDGGRYYVIVADPYGAPVNRWDFVPAPGGSRAELRSAHAFAGKSGAAQVRECAN